MYPFAFASFFFFYYFIILYFVGTQGMLLLLLWLQQCNDSVHWLFEFMEVARKPRFVLFGKKCQKYVCSLREFYG